MALVNVKRRNCANCRYSEPIDMGGPITIGEPVLLCRHSPPSLMLVPGPGGMQSGFGFPQVTKNIWCHQFTPVVADLVTMPSDYHGGLSS